VADLSIQPAHIAAHEGIPVDGKSEREKSEKQSKRKECRKVMSE